MLRLTRTFVKEMPIVKHNATNPLDDYDFQEAENTEKGSDIVVTLPLPKARQADELLSTSGVVGGNGTREFPEFAQSITRDLHRTPSSEVTIPHMDKPYQSHSTSFPSSDSTTTSYTLDNAREVFSSSVTGTMDLHTDYTRDYQGFTQDHVGNSTAYWNLTQTDISWNSTSVFNLTGLISNNSNTYEDVNLAQAITAGVVLGNHIVASLIFMKIKCYLAIIRKRCTYESVSVSINICP